MSWRHCSESYHGTWMPTPRYLKIKRSSSTCSVKRCLIRRFKVACLMGRLILEAHSQVPPPPKSTTAPWASPAHWVPPPSSGHRDRTYSSRNKENHMVAATSNNWWCTGSQLMAFRPGVVLGSGIGRKTRCPNSSSLTSTTPPHRSWRSQPPLQRAAEWRVSGMVRVPQGILFRVCRCRHSEKQRNRSSEGRTWSNFILILWMDDWKNELISSSSIF